MENEISRFLKVCFSVLVSLSYCYGIGKTVQKRFPRLLLLLPVLCQFLCLPFNLSSVHFIGFTAFIISWLANFKLLLFAFNKGPLSSKFASISLPLFVTFACFPIKIQQNQSPKSQNFQNQSHNIPNIQTNLIKTIVFIILAQTYAYRHHINPLIMQLICFIHMYLILEIVLTMVAYMARAMFALDLEPPFNEPYFSSSLQDFWGRRWNLIVSSILRPTVYDPAILVGTRVVGRKFARIFAVFATFFVSGIMHELMIYYLGRSKPSWDVFWFFILHGVSLIVEIVLKKALKDNYRLPTVISTIFTFGFFIFTGYLLFLPQIIRFRVYDRAFDDYAEIGKFFKKFVSLASWYSLSINSH